MSRVLGLVDCFFRVESIAWKPRLVEKKDDSLPRRFQNDPLPEGMAEGKTVKREDLEKMLSEYYSICGWDENGILTKETLEKLNLHR